MKPASSFIVVFFCCSLFIICKRLYTHGISHANHTSHAISVPVNDDNNEIQFHVSFLCIFPSFCLFPSSYLYLLVVAGSAIDEHHSEHSICANYHRNGSLMFQFKENRTVENSTISIFVGFMLIVWENVTLNILILERKNLFKATQAQKTGIRICNKTK